MRRTTTRFFALGSVLALSLSLAACGGGGDKAADGGGEGGGEKLNIGIKYDQPGLGLRTGSEFSGFDVDIAKAVAKELGYEESDINFLESVSSQRETLLQNGQVDMIFATYSITDARRESVDFAGPYFIAGQDLLVRVDDNEITGPDAMGGKTLCSVEGSTSAQRIRDEYSTDVELYPAQTYAECVEFLVAGTVDAVTTDDIILAGFAGQEAYAGKFKVVGNTFSEELYGVGLPKGSKEQCEKINGILEKLIEDGTWEELLKKNTEGVDYTPNADLNPPTMEPCA